MSSKETQKIKVWDLPTRLFHWFLLISIVLAFITVKVGGDAMIWHFYCGYFILALLIFRILWGLFGNKYARFSSFKPNVFKAIKTLKGESYAHLGHNPLGAFSVYAILFAVLFQGMTGLFSNDDIASEGPLMFKISKELSDTITSLHKLNEKIIIVLIILHIMAITYYRFIKRDNLIVAMITGSKEVSSNTVNQVQQGEDSVKLRLKALLFFLCALAIVRYVTTLNS